MGAFGLPNPEIAIRSRTAAHVDATVCFKPSPRYVFAAPRSKRPAIQQASGPMGRGCDGWRAPLLSLSDCTGTKLRQRFLDLGTQRLSLEDAGA